MEAKLRVTEVWTVGTVVLILATQQAIGEPARRYDEPLHQLYRLDWCLNWSAQCGEPAASTWCRARGYVRASAFEIAPNIGEQSPTKVFRSGQICNERFCDGFSFIVCEGSAGIGHGRREADALHRGGLEALREDRLEDALEQFQRAAALRQRAGDRSGEADSLVGVAVCYEALARYERPGWPSGAQPVYQNRSMSDRALRALSQAVEIFRLTGDRPKAWRALFNLGVVHEKRGEDARALAYYREALQASITANQRREAEFRVRCGTVIGKRLSRELLSGDRGCPKGAFGSVALLFDEEEDE